MWQVIKTLKGLDLEKSLLGPYQEGLTNASDLLKKLSLSKRI